MTGFRMKNDTRDDLPDHPALRIIGLVPEERPSAAGDAARDHDRVLSDLEAANWASRDRKDSAGPDGRHSHEQA